MILILHTKKALKMERFHKSYQEKAKKIVEHLYKKTDAQFTYCASPLQASNHYLIFQSNHIYHTHPLVTTA